MAKLPFTKLSLKNNNEIKTINYNNQIIEVKQYLPINTKLELISNVINSSMDNNNFSNPVKEYLFLHLEIVENYTNITFTDKQKEDVCKLYDNIVSSGLYSAVMEAIEDKDVEFCQTVLEDTVVSIYKYNNSLLGVVDALSQKYDVSKINLKEISEQLKDPNTLPFLKEIMGKLG